MIGSLPRLHAVTDDRVVSAGRLVERAAAMSEASGFDLAVHLRTRRLEGRSFLALARELLSVLSPRGSWLVINDRADVARAAGAQAVVTGRTGLSAPDVRRVAALPVGRSVHSAAEAQASLLEGADFLVAGAVYRTESHPDAIPGGVPLVLLAVAAGKPVIAIGGVTPELTPPVMAAGAAGVAAIRALWDASSPAAAAHAFLGAMSSFDMISLVVNGERRRARAGTTLTALLEELSLDPRSVVVEHNRSIVRRDGLSNVVLSEGDAIELVHFVGGG